MQLQQVNRSTILTVLSFAQMCKFFSHFGIRTLLILYLVEHLHYSDTHAFGTNAVFCGLSELGGIFGGLIADKYLGLRREVLWGGCLLLVGYASFFFENFLFMSMGLIITGSSFFSSNITALLGSIYEENDPQRKRGFTLFYMMQNLGALMATILCGFIAMRYGFRLGFLVASLGMVVGHSMLLIKQKLLHTLENTPAKAYRKGLAIAAGLALLIFGTLGICYEKYVLMFLPFLAGGVLIYFALCLMQDARWTRKQVYSLFVFLGGLILFFAVEDQICSSLLLFAQRETQRSIFGWTIPSSVILTINPIVILLCGTMIAKRTSYLLTPFILSAGAFGILAILCLLNINCSVLGVMGAVIAISLAELMIGPLVLSKTSQLAARGSPGMVMGMVPIAFSLAFQLSGGLSKIVAIEDLSSSLQIYGSGFGIIALLLLLGGVVMQILVKRFYEEKSSVC
ncbi:MAG: MFS transporter [Verrucomicrobia bacterium]|nr:MFS transporter [Verrucomicrobiota bacterium]